MTAPVAVVGLGPVGATLALLLARAGVPTIAIEREPDVFPLSRAVALDDEALRVLQAAGLGADQLPGLLTEQTVRFRSRLGAPLIELPPRVSPNGHPAIAFFHQPDLERALREELRRQTSVTLLLGHVLEGFRQHVDGVSLTVRDRRTGSRRVVDAKFLLGCDGGRSLVRRELGIRLRGMTFARRWLVVDTQRSGRTPAGPFEFVCDPARPTVAAPLPEARQRWEFMLLPGEEAAEMEQPAAVRALIGRFSAPRELEVLRATVYTFHARVAERWRDGRAFVVGDAAHLSPPFAGQGLSAGLRDAHNLAWKVAAVADGSASSGLLDTYETERRPRVTELIALAVLLGTIIQTRRRSLAAIRDAALRMVLGVPGVRSWLAGGGWKPPSRYRHGLVRKRWADRRVSGRQLPQPSVLWSSSEQRPLDDVLGCRFALIGLETDPSVALDAPSRAVVDALSIQLVHVSSTFGRTHAKNGVVSVRDPTGALQEWFKRAGGSLALVRPDRHVYAVFAPNETASTLRALASDVGLLRPPPA